MLSWCCLQLAVAGTSTIFAPTLVIYCGLRFVAAFGMAGILLSSLTLSECPALLPWGRGWQESMGLRPPHEASPARVCILQWWSGP